MVLDPWMGQVRAGEWNRSPGLPTLLVRLPKTKKQKGVLFHWDSYLTVLKEYSWVSAHLSLLEYWDPCSARV